MAATTSALSSDQQFQLLNEQIKQMESNLFYFEKGEEFFEALNAGFSISFQEREFSYPGLKIEKGTPLKKIEEIAERRRKEVEEQLKKIIAANQGINTRPYSYTFSGEGLEFLRYQKEMLWIGSRLIPIQLMINLEEKRQEREKLLKEQASKV